MRFMGNVETGVRRRHLRPVGIPWRGPVRLHQRLRVAGQENIRHTRAHTFGCAPRPIMPSLYAKKIAVNSYLPFRLSMHRNGDICIQHCTVTVEGGFTPLLLWSTRQRLQPVRVGHCLDVRGGRGEGARSDALSLRQQVAPAALRYWRGTGRFP